MAYFFFSLSFQMLTVLHSIHFQTTTFSDTTKSHHTATNYYEEPQQHKQRDRKKEKVIKIEREQAKS